MAGLVSCHRYAQSLINEGFGQRGAFANVQEVRDQNTNRSPMRHFVGVLRGLYGGVLTLGAKFEEILGQKVQYCVKICRVLNINIMKVSAGDSSESTKLCLSSLFDEDVAQGCQQGLHNERGDLTAPLIEQLIGCLCNHHSITSGRNTWLDTRCLFLAALGSACWPYRS